jgi:hypothetical protein
MMKKINIFLDTIGICISMLLIICGDGDFGDYWFVLGWLFFSVVDIVIRWTKMRKG